MTTAPNENRFTVLLADEPEDWPQRVRQLLQPQGVQTVMVRSGREALDVVGTRPIHMAVLDLQMPQLGGLQVLRLMSQRMSRVPPSILLTPQPPTRHLLNEALGMHVFSVLAKPVDLNVLLDTMARVMRRYYEGRWPGEG